ncbi:MAG: Hsp70 family protein, partial [Caulobacteraceae bacterium]
ILGRPVVFAGASPDESLALTRYGSAFDRLGFADRAFAYEPVGAAFFFARRLAGRATVLVADFGGGTSDFSVMRFERTGAALAATPLSHSGVGVAGDAFDFRIIDEVVSPRLGKGGGYRSDGKVLGVPQRYYATFARWNQLTLMKWSRDLREIREIARTALDPEALDRFIRLIENDHGYALYQAVSRVKEALSGAEAATLDFHVEDIDIQVEIRRSEFERWIGKELDQIRQAVDRALADAGCKAGDIDKVFLTGGSSLVPAVRAIFADRFGEAALESGGEFESIASGLALIGAEPDPTPWCQTATA